MFQDKVAVLGLGSIGLRHAKNAMSLGAHTFGYDPSEKQCEIAARAGLNVCNSRDEAISQATHVVIATPSIHHADDLEACLGTSSRVLVEKPLTHDPEGIKVVLDRAQEASTDVFCGFNLRFHEVVREAKKFLNSGQAGKTLWCSIIASSDLRDWRPGQDIRQNYTNHPEAGGVLFDYSHEIDLAYYLFGSGNLAFSHISQSGILDLQVEDFATVGIIHDAGPLSTVQLDYCSKPACRTVLIRGERATLSLDLIAREFSAVSADGQPIATFSGTECFDFDYVAEMTAFLGQDHSAVVPARASDGLAVSNLIVNARKAGLFQTFHSKETYK